MRKRTKQHLIDKKTIKAMTKVIDYLWVDEEDDFYSYSAEDRPANHLFSSLMIIDHYLSSKNLY